MSALDQTSRKRRLKILTVFEASLRFRHVLTYRLKHTMRLKDAKQEKLAASVLKPILS
jgi:hypothetical protein